jgi:DNA-binding CsgD family transcriptional regulator
LPHASIGERRRGRIGRTTYPGPALAAAPPGAQAYDRRVSRAEGWAAFALADWEGAAAAFGRAVEEDPQDADARDGLGQAVWWLGRRDEGIDHRRAAYALHRRAGDMPGCAKLAVYLAGEHRISGATSAANGWLARARTCLAGVPESAVHGWLEVEEAKRAPAAVVAERHAREALAIGRRVGNADVEVMALSQLGLACVSQGRVQEGLTLIDEAMAAATGGEASDPLAISDTCCTTLVACDRLADLTRAVDWCRIVVDFSDRRRFTPLLGWCRALYAGVLTSAGEWALAEEELAGALAQADRKARALALARLAELRVRQGRLEEAEQLLSGCEHPAALRPRVELSLGRGEVGLARALVERRQVAAGADRAARAEVLPLRLAIALAESDLAGARTAVAELQTAAEQLERADLLAQARHGAARADVLAGDLAAATEALDTAVELFARLGMPLEEGRARLDLARVHADEGSPLGASEAVAARDTFERLGASADANRAAELLRELGSAGRTAVRGGRDDLTPREREVLALLGEGLSNAAIAERLVISPKTAEHHVARVLGKLGLSSRAQAAALLAREGPAWLGAGATPLRPA